MQQNCNGNQTSIKKLEEALAYWLAKTGGNHNSNERIISCFDEIAQNQLLINACSNVVQTENKEWLEKNLSPNSPLQKALFKLREEEDYTRVSPTVEAILKCTEVALAIKTLTKDDAQLATLLTNRDSLSRLMLDALISWQGTLEILGQSSNLLTTEQQQTIIEAMSLCLRSLDLHGIAEAPKALINEMLSASKLKWNWALNSVSDLLSYFLGFEPKSSRENKVRLLFDKKADGGMVGQLELELFENSFGGLYSNPLEMAFFPLVRGTSSKYKNFGKALDDVLECVKSKLSINPKLSIRWALRKMPDNSLLEPTAQEPTKELILDAGGGSIGLGFAVGLWHLIDETKPLLTLNYAFTGTISPLGQVGKVDGYENKLTAASNLKLDVILPKDDIDKRIKQGIDVKSFATNLNLKLKPVNTIEEASEVVSVLTQQIIKYLQLLQKTMLTPPTYYPPGFSVLKIRQRIYVSKRQRHFDPREAIRLEETHSLELEKDQDYNKHSKDDYLSPSQKNKKEDEELIVEYWDNLRKGKLNRVVLLGHPGTGKTWILKWEGYKVADEQLTALDTGSCNVGELTFPIFLPLQLLAEKLVHKKGEKIEQVDLITALVAAFEELYLPKETALLAEWLKYRLEKQKGKNCLLLLDGLDEVRQDLKSYLLQALKELDQDYQIRMLLTSRVVSYEQCPFAIDFTDNKNKKIGSELELVTFDDKQINGFIVAWFGDNNEAKVKLQTSLKNKPTIKTLAKIPLMLSFICKVFISKNCILPENRVGLYNTILSERFNGNWRTTNSSSKKPSEAKIEAKIVLLEQLGYSLAVKTKKSYWHSYFTYSELIDFIIEILLDPNNLKLARKLFPAKPLVPTIQLNTEEVENLLDELIEQDGIFIKAGTTVDPKLCPYMFFHKTAHEYLVAKHIAQLEQTVGIEAVFKEIEPYLWYEYEWKQSVIPMVAGSLIKPDHLLEWLLTNEFDIFNEQLFLAGRCLAECKKTVNRANRVLTTFIIEELFKLDLRNSNVVDILVSIGSEEAMEALVIKLSDSESLVRSSSAKALGKIGSDKAIDPLIAALFDSNSNVRYSAAEALGKIGSDKAIDPLITALSDSEPWARSSSAKALGEIGSDKAIDPLIATLSHSNRDVRLSAAEALSKIGSDKAIDPLIAALFDSNSNVRYSVARALGKIGNDKAIDPLITALSDSNRDVRLSATIALGDIGNDKAINPLITTLSDDYYLARSGAAETLGRIGNETVIDPLIAALSDDDDYVSSTAAEALGEIGNETVIDPLIAALFNSPHGLRSGAARALGKIGSDKAVNPLITALSDSNVPVANSIVRALGKIGSDKTVNSLITALSDPDLWIRYSVARALGKIGNDKAVDSLITALSDPHVRSSAAEALGEIGSDKAIDPLIATLSHSTPDMRKSAAEALGKIANDKAVDPLITALSDSESLVRYSAARALGKIKGLSASIKIAEKVLSLPYKSNEAKKDIVKLLDNLAPRIYAYTKSTNPNSHLAEWKEWRQKIKEFIGHK